MTLPVGEPYAGPWQVAPVRELIRVILKAAGAQTGRPRIVAIDGRSAAGKSTVAELLHDAVPSSAVVHTDDLAWNHSFFGWADLLADGVLEPVRRGQPVRYRPPVWDTRGRAGAVNVPAGLEMVLIEGVGAGQRALAPLVDTVVWVQSDFAEAERRGIARDIAQGVNGDPEASTRFWHEWMAEELAFVERQRPWERACVVVAGTPTLAHGPAEIAFARPPASTESPLALPAGLPQRDRLEE
jgi:hypothetical protein